MAIIPAVTRYSFGEALDEDDVLVVQGIEYPMQPIGMRAMRKMLGAARELAAHTNGDGKIDEEVIGSETIDAAIELIVSSVRPEARDKLREHIDETVGPQLIAQISAALTAGMSDLDPTQQTPSSVGSLPTGSTSTDGAPPEESTPST